MVKNQGFTIRVENTNQLDRKKSVYFERTVQQDGLEVDVNVILQAMQMLFHGDMFKISLVTYGG